MADFEQLSGSGARRSPLHQGIGDLQLLGAGYHTLCTLWMTTSMLALASCRAAARGELAGADYTCICTLLAAARLLALTFVGRWRAGELTAGADSHYLHPPPSATSPHGELNLSRLNAPSPHGSHLDSSVLFGHRQFFCVCLRARSCMLGGWWDPIAIQAAIQWVCAIKVESPLK